VEKPLELAGALRRVAGKVVVDVAVDADLFFVNERPQGSRPLLELRGAVDLDARVVDDVAVGAHPSHVQEVGGDAAGQREHLLARQPPCVREGHAHAMLSQKRQHAILDPAAMSELDAEADVRRKRRQQLRQRGQFDRPEVGAELNEDDAELLAQLAGPVVEQVADVARIAQTTFVGDLLRELEGEGELRR
jgi:hypothetical protein